MSSDAKPNQVAASIVREPSNAARKSLSDPQAAEINEVQRTAVQKPWFSQHIFHTMQLLEMLRTIVSQRLVWSTTNVLARDVAKMLARHAKEMRKKCSKNDRLTTESCSDQNYDNPNCRKGWHMVFLCSQVVAAWMPSRLIHMSIIAGSSRIVHLIAGISRLCHVTAYYFLQSYENMVLTIWSIVSYHFLPALSCPIVSNLKPAMAAMTTFSPRPPCAIHIWT